MMGTLVRKNVFLDPATLKRARAILGRRSESEAIREALELVAFRTKVMKGYDGKSGKYGPSASRSSDARADEDIGLDVAVPTCHPVGAWK